MAGRRKEPLPPKKGRYWSPEVKLAAVKAYLEKQGTGKEIAELYGISHKSLYLWAQQYRKDGEAGLTARSPAKEKAETPVDPHLEQEIVSVPEPELTIPDLAHCYLRILSGECLFRFVRKQHSRHIGRDNQYASPFT